jgi:hypothetical protein
MHTCILAWCSATTYRAARQTMPFRSRLEAPQHAVLAFMGNPLPTMYMIIDLPTRH